VHAELLNKLKAELLAELATIARPYAEAAVQARDGQNALPVWGRCQVRRRGDEGRRWPGDRTTRKLGAEQKESLFLSVCGDRFNPIGRNFTAS
jgi:hypothetical protein